MHESLPDDQICQAFIICIPPTAVRVPVGNMGHTPSRRKGGGLVPEGSSYKDVGGASGARGAVGTQCSSRAVRCTFLLRPRGVTGARKKGLESQCWTRSSDLTSVSNIVSLGDVTRKEASRSTPLSSSPQPPLVKPNQRPEVMTAHAMVHTGQPPRASEINPAPTIKIIQAACERKRKMHIKDKASTS